MCETLTEHTLVELEIKSILFSNARYFLANYHFPEACNFCLINQCEEMLSKIEDYTERHVFTATMHCLIRYYKKLTGVSNSIVCANTWL